MFESANKGQIENRGLMNASEVCYADLEKSILISSTELVHEPEPLVSIVILNYNGKRLLRACLESVSKTNYSNYEVIVVDNASNDESCTMVKDEFPNFNTIKNARNLGYSSGNN